VSFLDSIAFVPFFSSFHIPSFSPFVAIPPCVHNPPSPLPPLPDYLHRFPANAYILHPQSWMTWRYGPSASRTSYPLRTFASPYWTDAWMRRRLAPFTSSLSLLIPRSPFHFSSHLPPLPARLSSPLTSPTGNRNDSSCAYAG
jgi:hypothetical protein